MFEDIASAIARQDYTKALELINDIKSDYPDHPWLTFYSAQVEVVRGNYNSAQQIYQGILKDSINRKLISQTREALRDLEKMQNQEMQAALNSALSQPRGQETAVLILSAIATEKKKQAAQLLGKIFSLDPYNARLQLPSRGWRLFRTGRMGELLYYSQILQQAEIPNFCVPLNDLETLNVFQVQYLHSEGETVSARCATSSAQEGTLTFQWSQVKQRVEGRVPIFEQISFKDARGRKRWKTEVLDYVQFCDLQIPQRQAILRLCDQQYQFQQSSPLSDKIKKGETLRRNWVELLKYFDQKLPNSPCWNQFTPFGEGAIAFPETLKRISPHIHLKRRYESSWDEAFQLYSGLVFFKGETDLKQL